MPTARHVLAATVVTGVLAAVMSVGSPVGADHRPPEVVASGLDSPRHLTFGPNGTLYVVEAGHGGTLSCADHPLGRFCLGFTGAVTKVDLSGPDDRRVVTGLPSIMNATEALGPSDIHFTGPQDFVLSIGIGGSDEFRADFGDEGALLGTLVSGKLRRNSVSLLADVLANEAVANPDGTDIDSNPVGILRRGGGYDIADAGGNAVVRVLDNGNFRTLGALPPGSALAPDFLGLPPGTQIPTDAVPTSVVEGPGGALYVSQLTGFPFEAGDANIWRLQRGKAPTIYASGLTNVTDLAFASDGTLYAVQISSAGLLNDAIGALVRVTPGASQHETVLGDLTAPYGLALRGNHAYVSTCATCVGGGEVLKINLR